MIVLVWAEENAAHIAEHSVTVKEASELVQHVARPYPQRIGPGRYLIRGQTLAGRYLQVIYVARDPATIDPEELDLEDWIAVQSGAEVAQVIHARDLEHGERRRLRRRRRR
jgi:hypothetical protein